MKDYGGKLEYKGKTYRVVFNLNVMDSIQEKFGTLDKWGALTDGKQNEGEPNAKAMIFGLTAMINEGIDIDNEEKEENEKIPFLTQKQVGRMATEIGLEEAFKIVNNTVIESTKSEEKNA